MDRKIRILLMTHLPWREDNNIGNSYSNIFRNTDKDKYEFAHIYVRDGMPQNKLVHEYYHISEKKMMKRWLGKREPVGKYFHLDNCENTPKDTFSNIYNKARILRWPIFFLIRDIIGMNRCWITKEFDDFINDFKPDLVFGTLPVENLNSDIMIYVSKKWNIPLVTYPWDDYYAYNSTKYTPIRLIRHFMRRHVMCKTAAHSAFMYVITNLMKDEYEKIFKKECKLLFKGHEFDTLRVIVPRHLRTINMVYMGNIGGGRWKTLADIAKAIEMVNTKMGRRVMYMNVYTLSPKNEEILSALNIDGVSQINDAVPSEDVQLVMNNADILLHVEPFKRSEYLFYRASFSTKLVDYFYAAKCILAVGGMTASTDYLQRNNAAICITDRSNIVRHLEIIAENPDVVNEFAKKSWECGCRNHQIKTIQENMYKDLLKVIGK